MQASRSPLCQSSLLTIQFSPSPTMAALKQILWLLAFIYCLTSAAGYAVTSEDWDPCKNAPDHPKKKHWHFDIDFLRYRSGNCSGGASDETDMIPVPGSHTTIEQGKIFRSA